MSIASETLRAEAARYRRLKGRLDDAQALKAIDDLVNDLEARADVMEGNVSEESEKPVANFHGKADSD